MRISCLALFAFLLALVPSPVTASYLPYYQMTDLGTLGGENIVVGTGLNNAGDVVGYSYDTGFNFPTSPSNTEPFLYHNGKMTLLPGSIDFRPQAINDAGQIVGNAAFSNDAEVVVNGKIQKLAPQLSYSQVVAINNIGQAVGNANITKINGDIESALFYNGSVQSMGPGRAAAVNNSGVAVGSFLDPTNNRYAVLFRNGVVTDLGFPGIQPHATAINDAGQIAGYSSDSPTPGGGGSHALLDDQGVFTDLGILLNARNSMANAINNLGEVVGAFTGDSGVGRGFVYRDGKVENLNDLISGFPIGWGITSGVAINDSGQILAVGLNLSGREYMHALLLTPSDVPPMTPEPSSTVLLLLGAFACLLNRPRSHHP
jgi:probable HAF family extracellular repeat protein